MGAVKKLCYTSVLLLISILPHTRALARLALSAFSGPLPFGYSESQFLVIVHVGFLWLSRYNKYDCGNE